MPEAFLDHSHAIALMRIEADPIRFVTTRTVVAEIGNPPSSPRHRTAAVTRPDALHSDPQILILAETEPLCEATSRRFRDRDDTARGPEGIRDAPCTNGHFRKAGFRPLLRDDL